MSTLFGPRRLGCAMRSEQDWAGAMEERLAGRVPLSTNVVAGSLCTWRVGGALQLVARPRTTTELLDVARALDPEIPVLVVGRGSNLLVSDSGFDGLVVVLSGGFDDMRLDPRTVKNEANGAVAIAGGALALPKLARRCGAAGYTGLEFYVGIPGSVGGAVRMNAGGHGRETAEVLVDFNCVDLRAATAQTIAQADAEFGYRHSNIQPHQVVTEARFALTSDVPAACLMRLDEIVTWRRANQPGGSNAGSVFTNPHGGSAGRLIEAAGLKGFRVGGAVVSDKHANFIQTEAGATARDVADLIATVAARVAAVHGVRLHTEVQMVGFDQHPEYLDEHHDEHALGYPPAASKELPT